MRSIFLSIVLRIDFFLSTYQLLYFVRLTGSNKTKRPTGRLQSLDDTPKILRDGKTIVNKLALI